MEVLTWASIYQSGGSVFQVIKKVLRGEGTPEEEFFVTHRVAHETRLAVAIMALTDVKNADRVLGPAHADDTTRCAVCGWPLVMDSAMGCVRGNCSQRPFPEKFYAPERAQRERETLMAQLGQSVITPELAASKGIAVGARCIFCKRPYTGEVGFDDTCPQNPYPASRDGRKHCCYWTGWRTP